MKHDPTIWSRLLSPLFVAAAALAQSTAPASPSVAPRPLEVQSPDEAAELKREPAPITEARVRESLTWLASDERNGRDCPSPGLEASAEWLVERFKKAGLAPGTGTAFRHTYTLPGQRLDSTMLVLKAKLSVDGVGKEIEWKGDVDVRLLAGSAEADGAAVDATVVLPSDPRLPNVLQRGGSRKPTVVVVAEDHPMWVACAGSRDLLSRRLRNSAPVFLVRDKALPESVLKAQEGATNAPRGTDAQPPSWSIEWIGAASTPVDIPLSNVVGVLRGAVKPDEYVVVSAHYDHIGTTIPVDGDAICNGADDDATGTTAVVLLAEKMAQDPRSERSIAFVCFSAEEKGLRGSAAFADSPPFPLESIVANINIEMLGRPQEGKRKSAWITGADYSDFAAIATEALQQGGIEVIEFQQAKALFAQSDNLSFVRKGIVAHSISAGSLHADYHRPSDEVSRIDVPHMTAVIQGMEHVVRAFADRAARPQWTAEGDRVVQRLRDQ